MLVAAESPAAGHHDPILTRLLLSVPQVLTTPSEHVILSVAPVYYAQNSTSWVPVSLLVAVQQTICVPTR